MLYTRIWAQKLLDNQPISNTHSHLLLFGVFLCVLSPSFPPPSASSAPFHRLCHLHSLPPLVHPRSHLSPFPPFYSQAFFNCWLSLWEPKTSQHNFLCVPSPIFGSSQWEIVERSCQPQPLPSLSPTLVTSHIPSASLAWWLPGPVCLCRLVLTCVPCLWHNRSLGPRDFPSFATCLDPPPLNSSVCSASSQLLPLSLVFLPASTRPSDLTLGPASLSMSICITLSHWLCCGP